MGDRARQQRTGVTPGSGNVFADLGFADAEDLMVKAELTRQIHGILKARRLTQREAGELLGLAQPDVSLLMRGRHTRFSVERLIKLLTLLGRDVHIVVSRRRRAPRGRLTVEAKAA